MLSLNMLVFGSACAAGPPAGVIHLLMDDWGYGDVESFGSLHPLPGANHPPAETKTPQLQKMANEGLVLSDFYSAASICSPSRVSWVTGRFPASPSIRFHNNPGHHKDNIYINNADFLNTSVPTVYKIFNDSGWRVGFFGKWALGGGRWQGGWMPSPSDYGVQIHATYSSNAESGDPRTPPLYPGCPRPQNMDNCTFWASLSSELIVNKTIALMQLANAESRRFYVQSSFHAVHATQVEGPKS